MFGKKKKKKDLLPLEGVITFFGSHNALRAERILKENDYTVALIPGPRAISPNCGVALRFDYTKMQGIEILLLEKQVKYEAFHHYPLQTG